MELAPDRTDPRFALAYSYNESKREAEALFHYRQYLLAKDDPVAWNNLGVAASSLKLPVTAVSSYLRADQQGSTLATSNLAFDKLEAGFVEEATELCGRGLKATEPDARLYDALAKCKRAQADEATREAELLDATKLHREVRRAMGKASLMATPHSLRSLWLGPHCPLAATFDGTRVVMKGAYERKPNAISGLAGGLFADKSETITVEYIGELYGAAFVGKVKTSTPSALASVLTYSGSTESDCLGYLDSNGTQFVILQGRNQYVLLASGESQTIAGSRSS